MEPSLSYVGNSGDLYIYGAGLDQYYGVDSCEMTNQVTSETVDLTVNQFYRRTGVIDASFDPISAAGEYTVR